jgi:NurA-like 5'-3' nuclease
MKRIFSMMVLLFIIGVVNSIAQSEKKETPPPKEPPKVDIKKFKPPVATEAVKSNNAFFKRNPTVANIWIEDNLTIIKLKSGKKEKYNLKNETEKNSFVERYGEPPIKPPKVVNIKKIKAPPPPPKPANEQN